MKRKLWSKAMVNAAVCLSLATLINVSVAEEKKESAYKKRISADAETYDAAGNKVDSAKDAPQYPLATRIEKDQKGATAVQKLRNDMVTAFQKGKDEEAEAAADKLEANTASNVNDKSTAMQVKLLLISKKNSQNHAAAIPLLEDIIRADALSNNIHYSMMRQLAQRYLIEQDYENALEISSRFMAETKTQPKEILGVKGNALYRLKKPKDAIVELEKVRAIDKNDPAINAMLSRAYSETGQQAKASEVAKEAAQSAGNDKASRINLAITYADAKNFVAAADVIDDLRKSNQLTEERDYLVAMNVYGGMKNREADIAAIMQDGFDKSIIKPNVSRYNILAQSYYYSDNTAKAIENWQKAAPLDSKGTTYLNLAIVQCQEEQWQACKTSAQKAIEKGGINAADAKQQISNADKGLGRK
jgi:tetratricopeptide (TPR) repeat protein